ncbi:PAS domain protein [Desulfosarcina variabilis str. Montpellier]
MPEDEAKRLEMVFQNALEEGRLLKAVENVNIHKDGSRVTLETNAVPIFDESGATIGYRGVHRNITDRRLAEKKLKEALNKVKVLSGMLPICASCKKIRDDKGYWQRIESYISEHSEAVFSHSLCPDCAKKLYPEIYNVKDADDE